MSLIDAFSETVTEYFKDFKPCPFCDGLIHAQLAPHCPDKEIILAKKQRGFNSFAVDGTWYFRSAKAMVQWYLYHRQRHQKES